MAPSQSDHSRCLVCGQDHPRSNCVAARAISRHMAEYVAAQHPDTWGPDACVCRPCLVAQRSRLLGEELSRDRGELSTLEAQIAGKAAKHQAIAEHIEQVFERQLTVGQRLANGVAAVGGSWPFVIGFGTALALWITLNTALLRTDAFDPYPYILLNLMLSCLAAIQAPIIMMSQNRSAERDRLEADEDYKINLKAELEIATLHEKMDHLLHVQWQRLLEMQEAQIEMLEGLAERSE